MCMPPPPRPHKTYGDFRDDALLEMHDSTASLLVFIALCGFGVLVLLAAISFMVGSHDVAAPFDTGSGF